MEPVVVGQVRADEAAAVGRDGRRAQVVDEERACPRADASRIARPAPSSDASASPSAAGGSGRAAAAAIVRVVLGDAARARAQVAGTLSA